MGYGESADSIPDLTDDIPVEVSFVVTGEWRIIEDETLSDDPDWACSGWPSRLRMSAMLFALYFEHFASSGTRFATDAVHWWTLGLRIMQVLL